MGLNKFLKLLTPKERKFYPMFEEAADNLVAVHDTLPTGRERSDSSISAGANCPPPGRSRCSAAPSCTCRACPSTSTPRSQPGTPSRPISTSPTAAGDRCARPSRPPPSAGKAEQQDRVVAQAPQRGAVATGQQGVQISFRLKAG